MVRLQEIGQTRVAVVAHQIEQLCRSGTLLRMLQLAKKILYGARKKVSRHLLAAGAEALHEAHAKVRPRDQARGVETRLKASEFERAIVAHVHQVQGDETAKQARWRAVAEAKELVHTLDIACNARKVVATCERVCSAEEAWHIAGHGLLCAPAQEPISFGRGGTPLHPF